MQAEHDKATPLISGFTLVEMLVVLAVLGILLALGVADFRGLKNDAGDAAQEIGSSARLARMQAMENTRSARLTVSASGVVTETNTGRCNATSGWSSLGSQELPERITLTPATWQACFDSRGTSRGATPELRIEDQRGRKAGVMVYLSGQSEVVP